MNDCHLIDDARLVLFQFLECLCFDRSLMIVMLVPNAETLTMPLDATWPAWVRYQFSVTLSHYCFNSMNRFSLQHEPSKQF